MANRRMINSDLFSDDVFMGLNDIARLVWIGLIVMSADDQGRLQGFPDGWTDGQADSHRYKQMGNAVTVNVAEWIGKRIAVTK